MPADEATKSAVKIIIENVHRLIKDANILLEHGSAASARSLAILAFEEAGKGHALELGLKKPAYVRSHHEFRHGVASFVLMASICQKYAIDMREVNGLLETRAAGLSAKDRHNLTKLPIDPEVRKSVTMALSKERAKLSEEEFLEYAIEMRWLGKIGRLVTEGGVEKLRQAGLYVDFDDDLKLTSSPMAAEKIEALRWILSASRIISLLEHGEYFQSYSPLSEFIAASGRKFKDPTDLSEALLAYVKRVETAARREAPPEADPQGESCS